MDRLVRNLSDPPPETNLMMIYRRKFSLRERFINYVAKLLRKLRL